MTTISNTDLTEIGQNSNIDPLTVRDLVFLSRTSSSSASGQKNIVLNISLANKYIGKVIEIKDPSTIATYETGTISSINGTTVTLSSNLSNTYPANSLFYYVEQTRDIFDTSVSDTTEANILFVESKKREDSFVDGVGGILG